MANWSGTLQPDSSVQLFMLPPLNKFALTDTYFLRLRLLSSANVSLSDNVYWFSSKQSDVLDWKKSTWFNTPCKQYADFTQLQSLPPVQLQWNVSQPSPGQSVVNLNNPTDSVAFFVRLRLVRSDTQQDVAPVFWEDNYVTLFPHESVALSASYAPLPSNVTLSLVVELFNNISGRGLQI